MESIEMDVHPMDHIFSLYVRLPPTYNSYNIIKLLVLQICVFIMPNAFASIVGGNTGLCQTKNGKHGPLFDNHSLKRPIYGNILKKPPESFFKLQRVVAGLSVFNQSGLPHYFFLQHISLIRWTPSVMTRYIEYSWRYRIKGHSSHGILYQIIFRLTRFQFSSSVKSAPILIAFLVDR